eukprot:COSAG06_NODE_46207_length_348_cov_1.546185_2_plen_38_part_01
MPSQALPNARSANSEADIRHRHGHLALDIVVHATAVSC